MKSFKKAKREWKYNSWMGAFILILGIGTVAASVYALLFDTRNIIESWGNSAMLGFGLAMIAAGSYIVFAYHLTFAMRTLLEEMRKGSGNLDPSIEKFKSYYIIRDGKDHYIAYRIKDLAPLTELDIENLKKETTQEE